MSRTPTTSKAESEAPHSSSYFEQQRAMLARDVATGMEQVLQNVNKLNRSLEGIISVGNEFSSVEALWSHFESVMSNDHIPGIGTEGNQEETTKREAEPTAAGLAGR